MDRHSTLTWSWLGILTKQRYDAVREVFGSLDEALKIINDEFLKGLGCREETVRATMIRLEEFDSDQYEKDLQKRGIHLLSIEDAEYPSQLREIGDPPIFLYYRGDLAILNQPCIALVGTREMSAYGKRVTENFTPEFVHAGMVTVSGLAQGIDAAVAQESIHANGKTVAVLGHGMSTIYPQSNARLAEKIVESGGLLISEFPLDMPPGKFTFPARNRIIAGLSLGTVVLEAPKGSGAIITADLALDYGREVFAVPGQIFDTNVEGCHDLIARSHAKLVTSASDVLREIGVIAPESDSTSTYEPDDETEKRVFGVLTSMPQTVSDLTEKSGLPTGELNAALTMMELAGVVKNIGGGQWVKK